MKDNPRSYDDRRSSKYPSMQRAQRRRSAFVAVVTGLAGGVGLFSLGQQNWSLASPRDWAILVLTAFFWMLAFVFTYSLTTEAYFTINARYLSFPRWGGLKRGTILISPEHTLRREGRDEGTAFIVLFEGNRRRMVIPEDYLTDPAEFMNVLLSNGAKQLQPRFLRTLTSGHQPDHPTNR